MYGVSDSLRTGEEIDLVQITYMDETALVDELQIRTYLGLEKEAGPC